MASKRKSSSSAFFIPFLFSLCTVFSIFSSIGFAAEQSEDQAPPSFSAKKLKIIATLFPQYDFVRRIAGERGEVRLLLPPGAESHSFEPTPADIRDIADADVFIYTGKHMEPWAERLARSSTAEHAVVVDASRGINIHESDSDDDGDSDSDSDHEAHAEHEHSDGHDHSSDPHIWLDPVMAGMMADNIGRALAEKDVENAAFYLANARELGADIDKLNDDIAERIAGLPKRLLVFGDRFAFSWFFTRYGLEWASPYKSCTAGSEPGLRAVIDAIALTKREGIKYIYVEDMTTSRMAEVISKESGAGILRVDSLHNPPLDKQKAGAGYVSIMRENLSVFAKGLE